MSIKRDRETANRAEFQACVAVKFPGTSINTLFDWFKRYPEGRYTHQEIEEMWVGWNMHRDFAAGELKP